jgi:hypothetical protein
MAINILSIGVFLCVKAYYVFRNKQKDAAWERLSAPERLDYIKNSTERGCKRLDFRFAH